jgi:DNA-binding transcriptional ArsR family regulator
MDRMTEPKSATSLDLQYCHDFFEGLFRSNFFKCLNDETRQKIILFVGQYGGAGVCVSSIADQFDLDRTTISHHLAMLRDSNLVSVTRKGKERYYAVNSDYIITALEKVVEIFKSCRDNCRQDRAYSHTIAAQI